MVIMVEILDESEPKPFLGGWRDAVHDIEYHDAVAQTSISTIGPHDKPCAAPNRCKEDVEKSRSVCVQTIVEKRTVATSANSRVSKSVQADPGYRSIPVLGEIVIDVEELKRRREASCKIQRCFRRDHCVRPHSNDVHCCTRPHLAPTANQRPAKQVKSSLGRRPEHIGSRPRARIDENSRVFTYKSNFSIAVPKTRWCPSCTRVRRLEAFELDHRERPSRLCIDCKALRARRRAAVEANQVPSEQYERMLKELRRSEAARPDGATSLAFALGPNAIRYLVRDIWHGRSAISQSNQADELCLARLDPHQPWSPWNCLLATRREARMHEALARDNLLAGVYDQELLRKFRRMNMQARLYFETIGKPAYSSIFSVLHLCASRISIRDRKLSSLYYMGCIASTTIG
ncbi:unnamed protein product [Trichogramma brassicae]|uniref:Uncharacterized protein n=1 Tax=Trichogramma brassicae TaxID=86971 RepID=A0A6H5I397_9HYME|nr:unnamed protein product [Trichogramma brassicae]